MKLKFTLFCALLTLGLGACDRFSRDPLATPYFTTEAEEGTAIIHVSPKGSDTATGSAEAPLATLASALGKVVAGEKTIIRLAPGVYRERVQISAVGTEATPLIIEGARNGKGEWLSIIDGSELLNPALWKTRPEVGPGVYAYPKPDARLMLVNHRSVARLDQKGIERRLGKDDLRPKTINEVLKWPEDQLVVYRKRELPFWDTIRGVYTPSSSGEELWLRLKDGADPARSEVAIAPDGATVELRKADHVTLRNLLIRGGRHGVDVLGGQRNRIEHCYIPHGRRRINIEQDAADTAVVGNRLEMGFYGQQTGAWGIDDSAPEDDATQDAARKGFVYNYFKYWAGPVQISDDVSIAIDGTGETLVRGNLLDGGLIGIGTRSDVRVEGNVVRRMSSVGTAIRTGAVKAVYDGNLFSDCNINIRLQTMNLGPAREIYLLRNTSILPADRGIHFFVHNYLEPEQSPDHEVVIYQNTFLGGRIALRPGPHVELPGQALRNLKVFNNRFIGCGVVLSARRFVLENHDKFGAFDYNQIAGGKLTPHVPAVWMGEHNLIEESDAGWSWDDLSYTIPTPDSASERGINLARPYQIAGKEYPALPGLHPEYFAGKHPDPGAPEIDFSTVLSYDYQ